jgi:hypothetical protein
MGHPTSCQLSSNVGTALLAEVGDYWSQQATADKDKARVATLPRKNERTISPENKVTGDQTKLQENHIKMQ